MQRAIRRTVVALTVGGALVAAATTASAALINNGDFEAGLAGWTVVDQPGSFVPGTWYASTPGAVTPVSGFGTSSDGGSAHGNGYAVSDQGGPGSHALIRSFTIGAGATAAILTWDMFINDWNGQGPLGTGLDFTGDPTQIARVDILSAGASAFDVGAGVLQSCFIGATAGGPNDFATHNCDITATIAGGGTFQIRFAEADNQLWLNMGIDNVRMTVRGVSTVPEPGSIALLGAGLAALALRRRPT